MAAIKLPFGTGVYRNADGVELNDRDSRLVNGYVDELDFICRFPGLDEWKDLGLGSGARIDGLYWWEHLSCALAVADGKVFKLTYPNQVATSTELFNTARLEQNARASFCTDGTSAFIANGGQIGFTNGTADVAFVADGDAPTTVSAVSYLDTYILASVSGTNKFQWCDVGDPTAWNALSFASAAGDADLIQTHCVRNRQIFIFGTASIEIWESDGETPFIRQPGGFVQVGCIAPASVIVLESGIYWLDNNRRFVRWNGNSVERISSPYDKEIQGYTSVSDCAGDAMEINGQQLLQWNFTAANKTLVFNENTGKWSERGDWDDSTGVFNRWRGNAYCYCPAWGVHLVGDKSSSIIYAMSDEYHDDDGDVLRLQMTSGHLDFGTNARKEAGGLTVRAKRGHTALTTNPRLTVRWNNDNRGFGNEHDIDLGARGEREIIRQIPARGIFRTRQYEIVGTDAAPLIFGMAEQEVEAIE